MKVLLLGPPGAGKSTQAQRLSEALTYFHLCTGDMIRAQISAGTEIGLGIKNYYDRGELVPDEVVLELVRPHLEPAGRWVLDGFPRNEAQARELDSELERRRIGLSRVIWLEAPDEAVIGRISGRRHSLSTGRVYHLEHAPPPRPEDHTDRGPFVRREDDTEEAIRRQLEAYHGECEPLRSHYEKRGLLATVDARRPPSEVTQSVIEALELLRAG